LAGSFPEVIVDPGIVETYEVPTLLHDQLATASSTDIAVSTPAKLDELVAGAGSQ
jgi:hypothetical protein